MASTQFPKTSHYSELISRITGYDSDMSVLVETVIRSGHTALDHFTEAEFPALIETAILGIAELRQFNLVAGFCRDMGIDVPAVLAA